MATRVIELHAGERAVVCAECRRPFAHLASDTRHHVFPRGFSPPEVDRVECPACGYHNLPGMPPAQPRRQS